MKIQLLAISILLVGCSNDADVVSRNISTAADNFEVPRRIVFYNGITNDYILQIDGFCSLGKGEMEKELTVTCKTGPGVYKKHFLGISDNVTFFAEQIDPVAAGSSMYRVTFKPASVLPAIDVRK